MRLFPLISMFLVCGVTTFLSLNVLRACLSECVGVVAVPDRRLAPRRPICVTRASLTCRLSTANGSRDEWGVWQLPSLPSTFHPVQCKRGGVRRRRAPPHRTTSTDPCGVGFAPGARSPAAKRRNAKRRLMIVYSEYLMIQLHSRDIFFR